MAEESSSVLEVNFWNLARPINAYWITKLIMATAKMQLM
jgi:hypothetical protein